MPNPTPVKAGARTALVTGASDGIGRATADLLASRGWRVVGVSRRGAPGATWTGRVVDVDDDASVSGAVAQLHSEHGRLDAVVAAAGWGLAGPVELTSVAEAKAQVETLFWGAVRTTTAALPYLREQGGGRVVLVSSLGGLIALPFQAYYSAAKFALEGWAEALAYEVAPFGIHVTLVEPGNFRTGFTAARRKLDVSGTAYEQAAQHALEVMERDEVNGADPVQVAALIAAQLDARRPRRRVSVGRSGERVGLVAKRVLPHRWFEAAAGDALGV